MKKVLPPFLLTIHDILWKLIMLINWGRIVSLALNFTGQTRWWACWRAQRGILLRNYIFSATTLRKGSFVFKNWEASASTLSFIAPQHKNPWRGLEWQKGQRLGAMTLCREAIKQQNQFLSTTSLGLVSRQLTSALQEYFCLLGTKRKTPPRLFRPNCCKFIELIRHGPDRKVLTITDASYVQKWEYTSNKLHRYVSEEYIGAVHLKLPTGHFQPHPTALITHLCSSYRMMSLKRTNRGQPPQHQVSTSPKRRINRVH